jgi:hypothetical protein
MGGFDTANTVQNVRVSAVNEFGAPNFWMRYFTPSPAADQLNNDPVPECQAAWDSGGHYIGPISAPTQSRLSGSSAQGQADAQAYASALLSAYHAVGPLLLPANSTLYCWLDQEYSTSLSLNYWNGWAGYLDGYNFAGLGTYPLYPTLYCDPASPYPNCSTIGNASADYCYAVWSNEPEPCGTLKNPPSWRADTCAGYASTPTRLWQFGEQGVCGYSANVDLDLGASGFTTANYCFNVSSRP